MSALIDIVVTFIAAMVSAAFVHFGAHSEKPHRVAPPVEQSQTAYESAQYETVSDEMAMPEPPAAPEAEMAPIAPVPPVPADIEAYQAHVEAKVIADHAAIQAHIEARQAVKAQQIRDREIRMQQKRMRSVTYGQ